MVLAVPPQLHGLRTGVQDMEQALDLLMLGTEGTYKASLAPNREIVVNSKGLRQTSLSDPALLIPTAQLHDLQGVWPLSPVLAYYGAAPLFPLLPPLPPVPMT